MRERHEERIARYIVSNALNVPVSRFEDGRINNQVDAIIEYPNRIAALEIITDQDEAFNRQWDALRRHARDLEVKELHATWRVWLNRTARVKDVVELVPRFIIEHQDDPRISSGWNRSTAPGEMASLGAVIAYPESDQTTGRIRFMSEGWSGTTTGEDVSDWIEEVLRRQGDVPAKLLAHAADEKHAFIWATSHSSFGVQSALELHEPPLPLPRKEPRLPLGVTHVWVAGTLTSLGCLAWFPERGWWRPDAWPKERLESLPPHARPRMDHRA